MVNKERQIVFYESYFVDFYLEQTANVQEKIEYVFKIVKTVQNIPKKFFLHINGTDGLYEIRIEFEGNIYRIFCCFDKGSLMLSRKKLKKLQKKKLIWL